MLVGGRDAVPGGFGRVGRGLSGVLNKVGGGVCGVRYDSLFPGKQFV